MKNLYKVAVVTGLIMVSSTVYAAFQSGMSSAQIQAEVKAELAKGTSLANIASAALAAGVNAGNLTAAMLLAGANSAGTVSAVIGAGGNVTAVVNAALGAGVSADVVRSAALGAGANADVVASAINGFNSSPLASRGTGTPGLSGTSGGGGVTSTR